MDDSTRCDDPVQYKSPAWAQRWFLKRSRDNWKRKHMKLKADCKRMENRVNDVTKSRERWRQENKELRARVEELEQQIAVLQGQLASKKSDSGPA